MALTFPSGPSNGQVYTDTVTGNRYIYDSSKSIWKFAANNVGMSVSSTPPSNVASGSMWYNREIGRMFVYYDDGDSKQWVETVPAGAVDTNTIAGYVNPVFASMNAAFSKANTALQNTSGTFDGTLSVTGSVGIGNTNPQSKLHVANEIRIGRTDASQEGGELKLCRSSDDAGQYSIDVFGSGSTPALRMFDALGGTVFFNATPSGVEYIKFNPTQNAVGDANALDDYEEGTWTPTVGGNATYGNRFATYTKIGDTVRCYFDVTISSIGTGSVNTLSGFPFSATYNDAGAISFWSSLAVTVTSLSIQMNSSTCIFIGQTTASATCNNGYNLFGNSARVIGTVVYKTAT